MPHFHVSRVFKLGVFGPSMMWWSCWAAQSGPLCHRNTHVAKANSLPQVWCLIPWWPVCFRYSPASKHLIRINGSLSGLMTSSKAWQHNSNNNQNYHNQNHNNILWLLHSQDLLDLMLYTALNALPLPWFGFLCVIFFLQYCCYWCEE